MRRSARNGSYGDAMSFRGCHCHHDAVRFYRNAVNAVAVIMQILMFYPQGCAIASPWALLYRPVRAGFQLTEASRNKQCFQFRLSLFSIFLRVLSQTVDEPFFSIFPEHFSVQTFRSAARAQRKIKVLRRFVPKHAGKLKKKKDEMKTLFIPRSFG